MRDDPARPPARIAIVVNNPAFFLSHRREIALAARDAGYAVDVITPAEPEAAAAEIRALGLTHHPIPMARGRANPLKEFGTIRALYRLFRKLRPDLVHLVTIKPVLYGGLAARAAGVPALVAAISGLGHVFSGTGPRAALTRRAVTRLYRRGLNHPNKCVIFQNSRDREVLAGIGVALNGQSALIHGSGVDLAAFRPEAAPESPPLVVMVARMLREKGVAEFVEAAALLRAEGRDARFAYLGMPDPTNPAAIDDATLARWKAEGAVEFWGHRDDVPEVLARAAIIALPSYYGEGLPKALIEAAAAGRPAVTTDMPGCRDAVVAGETALLVPPRDATALASALRALLDDPAKAAKLGRSGRRLAEQVFSVDDVVKRHLDIYAGLLARVER